MFSLLLQQVCISIEILSVFLMSNGLCTSFQPDYLSVAKVCTSSVVLYAFHMFMSTLLGFVLLLSYLR